MQRIYHREIRTYTHIRILYMTDDTQMSIRCSRLQVKYPRFVSSSWTILLDVPTVVYVFDRIAVRVDSNVRGRREGGHSFRLLFLPDGLIFKKFDLLP